MERYKIIKEVGSGTFGCVWRALNKQTGEVVAIKKMKQKYYSWEDCINLREVKSLRMMNHPNIVKLKEVIKEHDILYFVFEYMECSLYQLMADRDHRAQPFSEAELKIWCLQVFQGLAYMHQRGFFHRDLKPENLLVSKDIIKIADFGQAREINSQPPYTEYISTRWYRAPEVLLQSPQYGPAVDMWAMGAIMAELFTLRPLFPGLSEADEIYKICSVIGSPTKNDWSEGLGLAEVINYKFPRVAGVHLSALIPSAGDDAVKLIQSLCSWDPFKRPTAAEVLQHPFFLSCFYVPRPLRSKAALSKTPPSTGTKIPLELKTGRRQNLKPTSNFSTKPNAPSHGVQRNLQDEQKYYKNTLEQPPRYLPPVKNVGVSNYMGRSHGISYQAERLSNMTIGSGKPQQQPPPPLQMKAGAWQGQSDLFLGRSLEILPGRNINISRKVAG